MTDVRDQLQTTLAGQYAIERELGGGGMSRVFLAREEALGRQVVVKMLSPELAAGVSNERFAREIQLAAQLQQANIVPVLTAGDSAGLPWYAMPYVGGRSLRERLELGPLPQPEAISILRDVARALAYAHRQGIVHRDIKPENILLSEGTAVVTDFGIAKALSASRTRAPGGTLTEIGTSLGTPMYMSPEQATGDTVDHRADIYAWGLVAYELLAGGHPFAYARGPQQLISAQIADAPEALERRAPDVSRPLAECVMACLAKSAGDRPGDAGALLAALDHVAPSSRSARRARRRVLAAAGIAAGAALAVAALWRGADSLGAPDAAGVAIAPVRVERGGGVAGADVGALTAMLSDALTEKVSRLSWVRVGAPRAAIAIATHVYPAIDSVDVSIRVTTRDGALRTLPSVRLPARASAEALRRAADPVVAVVGFATHPMLGATLLPLDLPSSESFMAFVTGMEMLTRADSTVMQAWRHLRAAMRLDTGFLQPALWMVFSQKRTGAYAYGRAGASAEVDSVLSALSARRERLTGIEALMLEANRVAATGSTDGWIDVARKLAAQMPGSMFTESLPLVLAEANRVNEAVAVEIRQYDARPPAFDSSAAYHRAHWLRLASFYHYVGDYRKQLEAARAARALALTDLMLLREELAAHAALGDSVAFERAFSQVATGSSDSRVFGFAGDVYLNAAQELIAHGHEAHGKATLAHAVRWFDTRTPQELESPAVRFRAALAYFMSNRADEAERIVAGLREASPLDVRYSGTLGRIAAARGNAAAARRLMDEIASQRNERLQGTGTYERAAIMAWLGERDRALALLAHSSAQGLYFGLRARLHYFPEWIPLRGDPRLERIIRPVD